MPTGPSLGQIYDDLAVAYQAGRSAFDTTPVLDAFYRRLPPGGGHLLDLGCGSGEPTARFFIERGWRATGVDCSPVMLGLAAGKVSQMTRILADMREVRLPDGGFDAATLIYSLFHVPRQDHPALFANLFRWLIPGGRLLFTYATKEYTGQDELDGYREFLGRQLFYSHTTPMKLRGQLEAAGFACESAAYRDIGGETFLWVTVQRPTD
jgi:ubiquinone/menaquinone biosynthesis C-methylase UbiE